MRTIVELDTFTDKYPALVLASADVKDNITVRIGNRAVVVDTVQLMDALVLFEPKGD